MIEFVIGVVTVAALGVAITCTGIGAGLLCVLTARGFLQGGANDDAK